MEEKDIKMYEIREDELNFLEAFVNEQPLKFALQPYAVIQNIKQRAGEQEEVKEDPKE